MATSLAWNVLPARRGWAWVCLLVIFVLVPQPAPADCSGILSLPLPGVRPRNGVRLQVLNLWSPGFGYRPLEIRATTLAANSSDRTLRVDIYFTSWMGGTREQQVTAEVIIPAGQRTGSQSVRALQGGDWYQMRVEVFEGGRKLDDLSMENGWAGNFTRNVYYDRVAIPTVLVIDRDAPLVEDRAGRPMGGGWQSQTTYDLPDVSRFQNLLPQGTDPYNSLQQLAIQSAGQKISDQVMMSLIQQNSNLDIRSPSDLPADWMSLSQIDYFAVELDEWLDLQQSAPQAARAIRDAIAMGANLLVWNAGTNYGRLGDLHDSLQLERPEQGGVLGAWQRPRSEMYGMPYTSSASIYSYNVAPQVMTTPGPDGQLQMVDPTTGGSATQIPPGPPPFVLIPLQMGRVVAIGAEEPFPLSDRVNWSWLLNSLDTPEQSRTTWASRHGLAPDRPSPGFWEFLIEGVGAAPVKSFLAMIGLFAIAIGPVNYWFLRRRQRLYLLLITVPLGAAIASLAMFTYALAVEGLGAQLRVRSYTQIDADGIARSWSRQAYYAAVAPSGGLQYPAGTLVYPIEYEASGRNYRSSHMRWEDERLVLASGFLPSRSLEQFLVLHQSPTDAKVSVRPGDPPQATNGLGIPLRFLVVVDSERQIWGAENIGVGQQAVLSSANNADWLRNLQKFALELQPAVPPGMDPSSLNQSAFFSMRWSFGGAGVALADGLLETSIAKTLKLDQSVAPRSFIAVTEQCPPTVPLGMRDAVEAQSFHLIRGEWE